MSVVNLPVLDQLVQKLSYLESPLWVGHGTCLAGIVELYNVGLRLVGSKGALGFGIGSWDQRADSGGCQR